jgi:hypothetical protein
LDYESSAEELEILRRFPKSDEISRFRAPANDESSPGNEKSAKTAAKRGERYFFSAGAST